MSMKVTLLSYTPEPEAVVAAAAKLCYTDATPGDVLGGLSPEKVATFLDKLESLGHESPMEHVSFTFGIEGVSRALLAQITRHRIASFSVQSQRYVDKSGFGYVVPPEVEAVPEAKRAFLEAMEVAGEKYAEIREALAAKRYEALLKAGRDEKSAKREAGKAANEDARFVLPNACETNLIVTMNARELRHFFELRCCERAQWEIRAVADKMLGLVVGVAPLLFGHAGPGCVRGRCPEGAYCCGKTAEVRERIEKIKESARELNEANGEKASACSGCEMLGGCECGCDRGEDRV